MAEPITYSIQIAERICDELAGGKSLKRVCEDEGFPNYATVRRWEKAHPAFLELSNSARDIGCHLMADECLQIADDGRNDWMSSNGEDDAGWKFNGEHVQRSKLRIETRLKLLAKWMPKVYGEKLEHSGPGGGPIPITAIEIVQVAPKQEPADAPA